MTETAAQLPRLANWKLELDGDRVCWLAIDRSGAGTNVLSRAIMAELSTALESLESLRPAGLVIYSAKEGSFIAGADIHEFPSIATAEAATDLARRGQEILGRIEALPCPSVSVINGSCLGGGMELALATTWRIALQGSDATLGLPEVQLGLHPGFGGTVRSVRLMGVRRAMELMLTGRSLTPAQAHRQGLVDLLVEPDDWRAAARRQLRRPVGRRGAPLLDRFLGLRPFRAMVADSLVRQAQRKAEAEHYPAPFAMIDLWREHGARGSEAFRGEAESFGRLSVTPTSRNLVRVFFLQDKLKHLAERADPAPAHVHVVGAGIMGGDIAAWCAARGLSVTLQDREMKYVQPALDRAAKFFEKRFAGGAETNAARDRLRADVDGTGVHRADVVIEAIFENLEAKQDLFRRIEPQVRENCILATNTSSIPLEEISRSLNNPARLIGLHYFNPVTKLPLVEVVATGTTTPEFVAAGLSFCRQIGKLPLPCRSHPGFLVNRILAPYLAEAMLLIQEGVPLPDIDLAATAFGMPMGPVELADSVGLDIALHVARTLAPVLNRPVSPELEAMVASGNLGRKSGRGFYAYQEGKPVRPRTAGRVPAPEIQDRLVLALLNESAACLHEGIVVDQPGISAADLVDAGVIFGTGFAPFRGGPLHYARALGTDTVKARLYELALRHGPRFSPSAGWDLLG